jgi:23S rRNA pseudoU1915 N3-methylase RlmH
MKLLLAQLFIFSSLICVGQTKSNDWKNVQVFEFEKRGSYPDSLEICGGEWFVKGNANSIAELNEKELKRIKKKVARKGCNVVYVDTRKVYGAFPGKLYILGLKG